MYKDKKLIFWISGGGGLDMSTDVSTDMSISVTGVGFLSAPLSGHGGGRGLVPWALTGCAQTGDGGLPHQRASPGHGKHSWTSFSLKTEMSSSGQTGAPQGETRRVRLGNWVSPLCNCPLFRADGVCGH